MAIKKEDFLAFAKALPEDCEINLRNAMSRAYYAAYHGCLELYEADRSANGGVHNKLIIALKNSPDRKDRQLGIILDQLRLLRRTADTTFRNQSRLAISKRLLNKLKNYWLCYR